MYLGKTIFLSGASRGIGQATAIAFARAGAKAVYLTARSEAELEKTKSKITEANPETKWAYMVCDVTAADQVKAAVEDCVTNFGSLDVADANAGYLGKWDKGVKCFAIHPGGVSTSLAKNMPFLISFCEMLENSTLSSKTPFSKQSPFLQFYNQFLPDYPLNEFWKL